MQKSTSVIIAAVAAGTCGGVAAQAANPLKTRKNRVARMFMRGL